MLNKEVMEDCHEFINYRRERRHFKTLEWQKNKFDQLWQKNTGGHSNIQNGGVGIVDLLAQKLLYLKTLPQK